MHIYNTPSHITAFSTTRDGSVSIHPKHFFMPHHQMHGTVTRIIDENFLKKSPLEQALGFDGIDAVCTNLPDVCVAVKTADCIPVLLWDDSTNVVSAVHAGWKGTMKRIAEANIELLASTYGTKAENLHAIIGPGIGPDSFEVGDEVYELFRNAGFDMEKLAKRYPDFRNPKAEKWHINLWECNRMQLIEKGVNPNNIFIAGIDTFMNYDRFFSARRKCDGRIINGIMSSKCL
ncbi:MAG: peptidoglycan editing factor PgeF [Bacteroidaceae bacterium]|nr:peptidoglycan editing factor PgeF [Bacteroidaceae bacterium]